MNAWMNPLGDEGLLSPNYTQFKKQSQITRPVDTWVTIDEKAETINDGWFVVKPNELGKWYDVPASYHNNGGGLSYADGHAATRKWKDKNLLDKASASGVRADTAPGNDLAWLAERSTILK